MQNDLIVRFTQMAKKVGCQVAEVPSLQAAGRYIAHLAKIKEAKLIQVSSHDLIDRLGLRSFLAEFEILASGPDPQEVLMADLGISDAVIGIAETGSLLVHLDPVDPRLVTMLPPLHAALLRREDLVESFEDGIAITRHRILTLYAQGKPSYLSWITGPSRTGDIEMVHTIGVHGPKELHIILVP
ncbi:MAG: lactate utilization protein C [Candidatus Methylomirabilales bacterium]